VTWFFALVAAVICAEASRYLYRWVRPRDSAVRPDGYLFRASVLFVLAGLLIATLVVPR
jgi:hypothetical protein